MPLDSFRSWASVWSFACRRKSWTAISVVTTPATRMPARKSSGSRTRSEENIAPYRASGGRVILVGVPGGRDLVADAPDRDDRRRVAELAPQLAHVDVHRARVAGERVAPDALEQLVARQHEAAVVEQLPEEVELLRRELDLLVADVHLAAAGVDQQVAVAERRALEILAVGRRAAQHRLDARDELAWIERLGQVVVGAD